ncbi:MAG: phytanoyl-CoA dioxygenase [Candidatus Latescibacteria bacterium]|nr:phytanoyl-CoA dioxygenase [Candidatus Latescibacterota bacterium]
MSQVQSEQSVSPEDSEFFQREGYLILPSFIEPDYNARLIDEVDQLVEHRQAKERRHLVSYREMGLLTSHPPLMDKLENLMGPRFAMHHIHSARHDPGSKGSNWHQDYVQFPQTNRSHVMVHVFYYLNGLNGEVGDLLVLPQSQNMVIGNGGLGLFGTEDLPGSLCVDDLPPGSAIIVHSALWHARRPKPGGEGRPRYFIDVSYCQHGVLWPDYPRMDQINATALDMGLDRDGRYAFLYDETQFFANGPLRERFNELNKGSLALQLKGLQ